MLLKSTRVFYWSNRPSTEKKEKKSVSDTNANCMHSLPTITTIS